jgi:hypothetical protein
MRRYESMFEQPWDVPRRGEWWRGRPGGGYDRRAYGDAHPGYGGYPGARDRGQYRGGYDREVRRGRGGYGGDFRGYDGDFARTPFVPEQAYRRHPEYSQPAERPWSRWDHIDDDGDEYLDDRQVLRGVQRRLYEDVWLDVDRIHVEVEDGVVTLTGEVSDFMEARYAWDDAWETPGVRGVVNNLTVRADIPRDEVHGDMVPQSSSGHPSTDELEAEGG